MRLRAGRPARTSEEGIIPLINIVFLMLIFFMVVGRISAADLFDVSPPRSASETPAGGHELVVLLSAGGRLALDGAEVSKHALAAAAAEKIRASSDLTVRLKADGGAEARDVVAVMEILRKAGAEKLVLFTERERP